MPYEHSHPAHLAREHPKTHIIHTISIISFSSIVFIDATFSLTTIFTLFVPLPIRIILFAFFLILGIYIGKSSFNIIYTRRDPEDKSLNKSGVYAYIRNPMFLMVHCIFLGVFFLTLSLLSLIPWAISFYFFNNIVQYEEKELEKIFGEEYLKYKKKVHRWILRLTPAKFD